MTADEIIAAVLSQSDTPYTLLDGLSVPQRRAVESGLLASPHGRAWLRRNPALDERLSAMLLAFADDFRQRRRDASLAQVVQRAPLDTLLAHAPAVAGGPAGAALWRRLTEDVSVATTVALSIVGSDDLTAAELTLDALVLDPLNAYGMPPENRDSVASAALRSRDAAIRGLAAEYIVEHRPETLLAGFDELIRDSSERVRGVAWLAALRLARDDARNLAFDLLADEQESSDIRRSALIAVGLSLPTLDLVDVLAILVTHPDEALAGDAADLLFQHHRHPVIAEAALQSPHERVRDIASFLLDPYRGSPAAGGSRPGDPLRDTTGIFNDMLRSVEERASGAVPEDTSAG